MAKFLIIDSFFVSGRGFVIMGDVSEGIINKGDSIIFYDGKKVREMKISEVEFVDLIKKKIAHIGLVIEDTSNDNFFKTLKLQEQIVEVKNRKSKI